MTLHLTYSAETTVPVEVEGLLPEKTCGLSLAEVERLPVFQGNRQVSVGELFKVSGNTSKPHLDFEGNLSGVHWIGAGMTRGTIRVHGSVGRHAGSEMSAGQIEIHGDAGDWLGAAMRGGKIHVHGNAGDRVGAAHPGAPRGMTGGTVAVEGGAGHEVGAAMRRGLIALGGTAGDLLGVNLLAGTILATAGCGRRVGANMRRGTIVLAGNQPPPLLPTFRHACRYRPTFLPLILSALQQCGLTFDPSLAKANWDLFSGDLLELGRGEILIRA